MRIESTFPLGNLVATTTLLLVVSPPEIEAALARHGNKEWGEINEENRAANERALATGERVLSAYVSELGFRFWIITEWDRSVTVALLPEDWR